VKSKQDRKYTRQSEHPCLL